MKKPTGQGGLVEFLFKGPWKTLLVGAERRHQGQQKYAFGAGQQMIFHVGLLVVRQLLGPVEVQELLDLLAVFVHGVPRFPASKGEVLGNFPVTDCFSESSLASEQVDDSKERH
jgi:hypothetical protein